VKISEACEKCFAVIRDVFLAAVVAEPEDKQFHNISSRYPRLLNFIVIFFCFYVVFLIFLITKVIVHSSSSGSFILTARTERIEYQPESIDPPRIAFRNATFHWDELSDENFDPLASTSSKTKSLPPDSSGSIQIQGKSNVVFSRIGTGSLHIQIKSSKPILVFDENDQKIFSLPSVAALVLNEPSRLINQGIAWKYNLDGPLIIGRVPTFGIQQLNGLLIDGEIQMVAKQLLSGNHYKVDPYKLQLGDELQFLPVDPKTSGMLTFDADRGLQVVAIVEAKSATIKKFRETNIQIRNNLWSKLGKDEEFVITWALMLTVPGILVFFTRILFFHKQVNLNKYGV
jgi:hypothetical protein